MMWKVNELPKDDSKEPLRDKLKRIYKSFIKTNGYVVATTSLNYCGARIVDRWSEGAISSFFGKVFHREYHPNVELSSLYFVLFFASVLLLFGVCFDCKVLIISFIFPFGWLLKMEEDREASYMVLKYIFSIYAGIVLAQLLMFGMCQMWKSKSKSASRSNILETEPPRWQRFLACFCCGTCQKIKQYRQVAQKSECEVNGVNAV